MEKTQCFQASYLHAITRQLFLGCGTPGHISDIIAQILVGANLAGHDSHGILRIPSYLSLIEEGNLDPGAEPSVLRQTNITVIFDGNNGSGLYTARKAMDLAINKAKKADICIVNIVRNHHIGRLGEYAEMAANSGCIGIITTGTGQGGHGSVLPYGGLEAGLGTNPIAVGVPTGEDAPFILDFATSMIASGKIMLAQSKQVDLPKGSIVDKNGNPAVKPEDYLTGGHLLPFGMHKGYALSLLTCLLGGLGGFPDLKKAKAGGTFMQVMDVNAFMPVSEYQQGIRKFLDGIRSTLPAPGFEKVQVPGDYEHRCRVEHIENGIEVPETTISQIREWAKKLAVNINSGVIEDCDRARY